MTKGNKKYSLTRKEQATTATYKMMSDKINRLEASLKKTQDGSEKLQKENHELDKQLTLLNSKLDNNLTIEIFKFTSTGGIGFAINYITTGDWPLGLTVGIPSTIVFLVCIIVNKK